MRPLLTLCALFPLLGGCYTYSCDRDVLACGEGEAFEIDPQCEAETPLSIEILEMQTLDPLEEDAWPIVHHGAQGGIHFELGIRVHGLEPDHREFELVLEAAECRDAACNEIADVGARTLNADASILELDEDGFLLPDVVVLLDREPARAGELTLSVLDACGRQVEVIHAVDD